MPETSSGLSLRGRLAILFATTLAVLVVVNSQIAIKQDIVAHGETLLLRLAPRDPRSLLQGDYMALRYAMADEVAGAAAAAALSDGHIVVEWAPDAEARFVALDQGQALAANQHRLRFRKRGDSVRLASDAFFFEEGQWERFADARFGELRVNGAGDAVLVGLRDAAGNRIDAAPH